MSIQKIDTAIMTQAKNEMASNAKKVFDCLDAISSQITDLQEHWHGEAAKYAVEEYRDKIVPFAEKFQASITSDLSLLGIIIECWKDTDSKNEKLSSLYKGG